MSTATAIKSPITSPPQTTKLKNDLKRLSSLDTVQYKPFTGGEPRLLKVENMFNNKHDINAPRLFIGHARDGKEVRVFEHQVTRVIFQSHEEYEDLADVKVW